MKIWFQKVVICFVDHQKKSKMLNLAEHGPGLGAILDSPGGAKVPSASVGHCGSSKGPKS